MNKVIVKEFERKLLVIDIMLYCIFITMGFILLRFPLLEPIEYASSLFYIFAFFSLLAYFANRRKDDYELLIFGFINVVTATFILIYQWYPNSGFILADAVLIYSLANLLNKGYHCGKLLKEKNLNFFVKVPVTILLLLLGLFAVSLLYNRVEAGSMILGYYFIAFGLLSLIEPLMEIVIKNTKVEKKLVEFLSFEDDTEENKKENKNKKVKEVKNQKPSIKEETEEVDEKEEDNPKEKNENKEENKKETKEKEDK